MASVLQGLQRILLSYDRCYLDTVLPRWQNAENTREREARMSKAMTLRLADEQARELEAIARVERIPVSELVREAIDAHIAARRKDKAFRSRLQQMLSDDREILERLAQ
jgi:predicted DNA-binding protein